jgi:hypothetical protein
MSGKGNQMSQADASRIQGSQVHCPHPTESLETSSNRFKATGGKDMSSGGFAARAQSAAATNANNNAQQGSKGDASNKK